MANKKITAFTRLHQQAGLSFDEAIALIKVSASTGYCYQSGKRDPSPLALEVLEKAAATRKAEMLCFGME